MGTCDRCDEEYESYTVYFTDDPEAIKARNQLKRDGFDNLCKPCRLYLVQERDIKGHAFTTENEDIEPKEDPNN